MNFLATILGSKGITNKLATKVRTILLTGLLLLTSSMSFAQDEPSLMSYDLATTAMDAAEAYAREQNWNVTILIHFQTFV